MTEKDLKEIEAADAELLEKQRARWRETSRRKYQRHREKIKAVNGLYAKNHREQVNKARREWSNRQRDAGYKLREQRERYGLDRAAMAQKLGIEESELVKWEYGQKKIRWELVREKFPEYDIGNEENENGRSS